MNRMRISFDLDRWLDIVRQAFPQVNREQTKVVYVDQIECRFAVVPPVLVTSAYDEVRRRPGWRARLLRIGGELFGVRKWYDRGMAIKHIPEMYYRERTIELRSFAGPANACGLGMPGEQAVICMGYDAETYTLLVNRERTYIYGGLI